MDFILAVEQWTLAGLLEVSQQFAHPVYVCCLDLEKAWAIARPSTLYITVQ